MMKQPVIGETLHPAKYSEAILTHLKSIVYEYWRNHTREYDIIQILDPFAGTGRIHELATPSMYETFGVEIEKPWADLHPQTWHGDATFMHWLATGRFDMIVTSPTYGNRFSDKHTPSDKEAKKWIRRSYSYDIRAMTGDPNYNLHSNNTGALRFSSRTYEILHEKSYDECLRVLTHDGWFVLNVSDFIKDHKVQPVAAWHRDLLIDRGLRVIREIDVETPRMRMGRNEKARVAYEKIYVMGRDK